MVTRSHPRHGWVLLMASTVLFGVLAGGAIDSARGAFVATTSNDTNTFAAADWTKWIEVDGGREFSCAANEDGSAWCWGNNANGQLGDNSTAQRNSPVQVVGSGGTGYLDGVVDIATGEAFACAALDDGSAWCWGRNDKGQMGVNSTSGSNYPVQVVGVGGSGFLTDVVDIAAGQKHACAGTSDGSVFCWGENNVYQLGDGTTSQRNAPVQTINGGVSGDYAFVDFSTGAFSDDDGTIPWNTSWQELGENDGESAGNVWVYSWSYCTANSCLTIGSNGGAFSGKGASRAVDLTGYDSATLTYDFQQSQASALSGSVSVQASSDGSSWTTLKTYPQSGAITSPVPESFDITSYISATTSIRMLGAGSVDGWFNFDDVQIAAATSGGGPTAANVAAGLDHSCAIAATGSMQCWGEGSSGQIGDGGTTDRSTPQTVVGIGGSGALSDVVEADAGEFHTCARHSDGSLTCWGSNSSGQLAPAVTGDGTAVWRESGTSTPEQAILNGDSFSTDVNAASTDQLRVIESARSADGSEAIVVGVDDDTEVNGMMWDGSSWTAFSFNPLADLSDSFWWSVDVEYESTSGDAVMVWSNASTNFAPISYRVWNGSTWSSASTITTPRDLEATQLKLAADPTSDEMVLIASNSDGDNYAVVWDGSSWGNGITLDLGAGDYEEDVNVAYEHSSGDALVTFGKGNSNLYYRTWNGTAWSGELSTAAAAGVSGATRWTVTASDPTSDRIVVGVITNNPDIWVTVWDGSAWGSSLEVEPTPQGQVYPAIGVAFEATTGEALAVYGEGTSNLPRYVTWTSGGGWSTESSMSSDLGADLNTVVLFPDDDTDDIVAGIQDDNNDLHFLRWDGSAWGADNEVETNTAENKNQPFTFLWDVVGLGGPVSTSTTPLEVQGHTGTLWSDAIDIGLGEDHTCAVTSGGAAYCWGLNSMGEIGDNTTTQRSTPTRVVGSGGSGTLDDVSVVGGGWNVHTCASVAAQEELWCWDRNNKGQLGDNSTSDSLYPVFAKGST